jgi:hypothetical protein
MHKTPLFPTLLILLTACHKGVHPPAAQTVNNHPIRFAPPDSSTYRYTTSSETTITVTDNRDGQTSDAHKTALFAVHYLITKDSDEYMMEMTLDSIDYHETNHIHGQQTDAVAAPGPMRELLSKAKTTTFFGRVRSANNLITAGGAQELANETTDRYYAPADRSTARHYWGQWVEQELLWRNLDPFVWVKLDLAQHPGDGWTDTTTRVDGINFKINKQLQFDTIQFSQALIRSQGQIGNDKNGTTLWGKRTTGVLSGTESGTFLIDIATSMPSVVTDTVIAESDVQYEGQKA